MGRSEKGSAICTIKYLFLIFNIIIWVLGCGVFAVGIWMQANRDSFSVVLPSHSFLTAASLVIIAGAITLVIGFVGCCGAIAENKCMMVVLQCCGVNNYTDWYDIKDRGQQVRPSCCVDPSPGCEKSQSFLWNTKGCMEEIEYLFSKNMQYIGIAGLCVAVIQILMMAACIMLFCNMRDKSKY
uniref:Tetraspanin n=1 Tax=Magallana gigas TaxID=29159 RepID=K1P6P0_MAGGI